MIRIWSRIAAGLLMAGVGGAAVLGCGGGHTLPTANTTLNTTGSTPPLTSRSVADTDTSVPAVGGRSQSAAQAVRCSAAVLKGRFEPIEAGAGQRHTRLVVHNTGSVACTIYGYGGLQLADANGTPVPTTLRRVAQPGPALVRLAPGGSAAKDLSWTVIPTGSEPIDGPCEPEANHANVIPPDETEPFTVPWNLGVVCHGGGIGESAYYGL